MILSWWVHQLLEQRAGLLLPPWQRDQNLARNKTYEGQVLNPAQVVSPFAAAVALCKRGNSLGESIFVGLPRWSDVGIVAEWCEVEVSFVSHDGGRGASA